MPRELFNKFRFLLFFLFSWPRLPWLEFSHTYHCLQQKMHKVARRTYKVFNTTTQLLTLTASLAPKGHFSLDQHLSTESKKSHKLLCGRTQMCMTSFKTRWFIWNQNYALVGDQHFTWQSCLIYHWSPLSTKITELVVIRPIKLLL